MKINPIASNMTEATLANGDLVLFSYKTPVAARVGGKFFRTTYKWSMTTSRHINKWLALYSIGKGTDDTMCRPQPFFEGLV